VVRFYADPPHLSVGLYCERVAEPEAFAALAAAVRRYGAEPRDAVMVVPSRLEFDGLTDLPVEDRIERVVRPDEFDRLVAGSDPAWTVVQAEFVTAEAGLLVLSYLRRAGDDRHPVEATVYADALGIPEELWEPGEAERAARLAAWFRGLARTACEHVDPLYAEVTIESTLPTPSQLIGGDLGDVYVADRLLVSDPRLEPDLRAVYADGAVARWRTGLYCSGWAPFNEAGRTMPYDSDRTWKVARLVDAAIQELP
jgi:hypothetical protein